jgi:VanZ like family
MTFAHRTRWSRARIVSAGLAGTSLALVPATTLARGDALIAWGRSCLIQPGLSLGTPEALLNALLFAPTAFFAMLALRQAAPVVLAVLASSTAVEAVQSVTALGTCQTSDVVRNVAGAMVACGVAALLLRMFATPSVPEEARLAP